MPLPSTPCQARRLAAGLSGTLLLLGLLAGAPGPVAAGQGQPGTGRAAAPDHGRFQVRQFSLSLPNGDEADIYVPRVSRAAARVFEDAFPVVAVLQGANVDRSHYNQLGSAIARQGFVVVIPNHYRDFPGFGRVLFSEVGVVNDVWAAMAAEDEDTWSPLHGIVDTERMGLIGHSLGGSVGLYAIAGVCVPAICSQFAPGFVYEPPGALRAAAVYGASLVAADGSVTDLDTSRAAVALVQGDLDGIAAPQKAVATYPVLEPTRALIEIEGANHYGICDENNPQGARADPNLPTLSQAEAADYTSDWIGLWLRAQIKDDRRAWRWLAKVGGTRDGVVQVTMDE